MHWYKLIKKASQYGYWINPSGQTFPVGMMQHAVVGAEILGYEEWNMPADDDINRELLGQGYVKTAFMTDSITVESESFLTQGQARSVKQIIDETGLMAQQVYLSVPGVPQRVASFGQMMAALQGRKAAMRFAKRQYGNTWYSLLKKAAIWDLEVDEESFFDILSACYELEYKFSMVTQRQFNGHPKRHEVLMAKLESALMHYLTEVRGVLMALFEKWLSGHAITNPGAWAEARTENDDPDYWEYDGRTAFGGVVGEYFQYKHPDLFRNMYGNRPNETQLLHEMLRDSIPNFSQMPNLQKFCNTMLQVKKEYYEDDLLNMGFEEFNEMIGQQFSTLEEAEAWIMNLTVEDMGLQYELDDLYDYEAFIEEAERQGLLYGIAKELYQFAVFPLWFGHWQPQGIESTRDNVENVYKTLSEAGDVRGLSAAVNIAINTVHQGVGFNGKQGQMLDYFEEYTGMDLGNTVDAVQQLDNLSNMDVEVWDQELREVGVQI